MHHITRGRVKVNHTVPEVQGLWFLARLKHEPIAFENQAIIVRVSKMSLVTTFI